MWLLTRKRNTSTFQCSNLLIRIGLKAITQDHNLNNISVISQACACCMKGWIRLSDCSQSVPPCLDSPYLVRIIVPIANPEILHTSHVIIHTPTCSHPPWTHSSSGPYSADLGHNYWERRKMASSRDLLSFVKMTWYI